MNSILKFIMVFLCLNCTIQAQSEVEITQTNHNHDRCIELHEPYGHSGDHTPDDRKWTIGIPVCQHVEGIQVNNSYQATTGQEYEIKSRQTFH